MTAVEVTDEQCAEIERLAREFGELAKQRAEGHVERDCYMSVEGSKLECLCHCPFYSGVGEAMKCELEERSSVE